MPRKYITAEQKRAILKRAEGRCEYCKCLRKYSPQPFVIEHIIALARGGNNDLSNLALACGGCNGHKYTKITALDSLTNVMASLYNPREHIWSEHFKWNTDFLLMIGVTAIGRATINTLRLNRKEVINLRELTTLTNEHPP